MNENAASQGGKIAGIMLMLCAFLLLSLAVVFLSSYPERKWWLGLFLLFSSMLMIWGGLNGLKSYRAMRYNPAMVAGNEAVSQSSGNIIANWQYAQTEWQEFIQLKTTEARNHASVEALVLWGTMILIAILSPEIKLTTALIIGGVVAFIYWIVRYTFKLSDYGKKDPVSNGIVITNDAVLINGKYHPINANNYKVLDVQVEVKNDFWMLSIIYRKQVILFSRKKKRQVPIPSDRQHEVEQVKIALLKQ
ncbi:hypothetical protein [Aridibaculum aurantiacum]|uniref:hypothetical protein n=1 Tax=Aridibaculum aurantiacum TaxID=2810307 RepID=UPI001A96AC87|nr:hypothetical protein [Aridibaculum aurantiacum]